MKTNELTGAALDWAVAKCEEPVGGYKAWVHADFIKGIVPAGCRYSTDWLVGGPIIEREMIATSRGGSYAENFWMASRGFSNERIYGPTPLIAAMRCYVASKLGDEVGVPEGVR